MFGFVQTPPRPNPGMPSLEPYNPLSGTVGVSPNNRYKRRPNKLTMIPSTIDSSLDGHLSPMDKLEQLTETIRQVLRAYQAQPARSLVYLASLKEFLRRALELNPDADQDESLDPPSPSTLAGIPLPYRGRGRRGRYGMERRTSGGSGSGNHDFEVDKNELDKLERDWWSSEVVVAWYGPRPGYRVVSPGTRTSRRESEREATIKRDASFVGLHDDGVKE